MEKKNKTRLAYQEGIRTRQEFRVLDALTEGPKTVYQLAEVLPMSRATVLRCLVRMMELPNRRVHVCGFDMSTKRGRFLYDAGEGKNMRIGTFWKNRLLAEIGASAAPVSIMQVCSRMGVRYETSLPYLRSLKKSGRIHIAEWAWSVKTAVPLYVAGKGEDVPKPAKRPEIAPRRVAPRTSVFAALGL